MNNREIEETGDLYYIEKLRKERMERHFKIREKTSFFNKVRNSFRTFSKIKKEHFKNFQNFHRANGFFKWGGLIFG